MDGIFIRPGFLAGLNPKDKRKEIAVDFFQKEITPPLSLKDIVRITEDFRNMVPVLVVSKRVVRLFKIHMIYLFSGQNYVLGYEVFP